MRASEGGSDEEAASAQQSAHFLLASGSLASCNSLHSARAAIADATSKPVPSPASPATPSKHDHRYYAGCHLLAAGLGPGRSSQHEVAVDP